MEVGDLDGYGRYGIVDENEDGILCHTCGKRYRNLATHLTMGHGDTVPDYRARHGLAAKRRLVAQSVRARMSEGWYANKDLHLADLEKHRDPLKAVRASVPYVKQRSAGAKASRDQYLRPRAGRPLTDKEKARLDTARNVAEWSTIALEILEDLTVSVKSPFNAGVQSRLVRTRGLRHRPLLPVESDMLKLWTHRRKKRTFGERVEVPGLWHLPRP